ncbi:hypothetical protein M0R45_004330 [Rubus argutus]|uniref:TF-B3 domain-containing protein n=1 Tax=Rubus argutus TaxID=59490 RepID=A0AAW1YJH3_RUBAR
MASRGWRKRQGPAFPVTTPSFFTMVFTQALEDGKLEIPRTVVRQCGDRLAETIFLKVPDGAQWGIELRKRNGKVWLQKGWPEFAEHYSLEHGSVLLFSSEGGYSHFEVQIFRRNTLEMNYPPNSSSTVEMNYASNSCHLEMNYPPNSSSTAEMNYASNSCHGDGDGDGNGDGDGDGDGASTSAGAGNDADADADDDNDDDDDDDDDTDADADAGSSEDVNILD